MEDMRKFEKPEMEVIVFEAEDILTTSSFDGETDGTEGANISDFMMDSADGDGYDVTEPTAPTSSAGAAEADDSSADSDVVDESVVVDEHGMEEPVMTEEVVEDIIEE